MNPSPADGTIGSSGSMDFERCLSPLALDDIEVGNEAFESGTSRSASPSPSASSLHSPGTSIASHSDSSAHSSLQSKSDHKNQVPLRPEQLRWFYREESDRKWTPFIGYDSLRIECAYRELTQRSNDDDSDSDGENEVGGCTPSEPESQLVSVRGGLYEADVLKRKTYPIYWNNKGESAAILRGTWFMDGTWQPLEEIYADQIEIEHLEHFKDDKSNDDIEQSGSQVVHHLQFKDFHVDWHSEDKVYFHSEATSSKFYRAVGNRLGLGKAGTRLCRGFNIEATMDDKPSDISHLVFVIHGIGQKMDTGSIAKSCSDLRETCGKVAKSFPDTDMENKRAEFLPVEWRSSLKLDGDTVESITPNKVRGLRTLLNASAMDILYYTSPLYRSEITHGLQNELNRLYTMFCCRHPYFEPSAGKVSIVAHSLGCVITYDIIMGWNPVQLYDQYVTSVLQEERVHSEGAAADLVVELQEARKRVDKLESDLLNLAKKPKTPTLNFHVDNLFCLGSPLAVFLALRGVRPKGSGTQDHILPRRLCSRLFNIYHPSDPIAYRLEPLILKHYSTLAPLYIHRFDQVDRPRYEDIPAEAYAATISKPPEKPNRSGDEEGPSTEQVTDLNVEEQPKGRLSGVWSFWGRRSQPEPEDVLTAELTDLSKEKSDSDTSSSGSTNEQLTSDDKDSSSAYDIIDVDDLPPIDHTDLEWRLDYQLREGKMESAYLATLTAHTSYWTNFDIGLFLLSQIFPEQDDLS